MDDQELQNNNDTEMPKENESELETCKKQAEEYLNNWKRERADFINYKKDEAKRMEEFMKFANESLILEIIDELDKLEKTIQEAPEAMKKDEKDWFGGLMNTKNSFEKLLLEKYGVERIKTDGPFNPELHEAVSTEEGSTKIEEVRAGYTMYGKVIRPARIKIIK